MLKTFNVTVTITKVLMLLENMRPFFRMQRNIGHFYTIRLRMMLLEAVS